MFSYICGVMLALLVAVPAPSEAGDFLGGPNALLAMDNHVTISFPADLPLFAPSPRNTHEALLLTPDIGLPQDSLWQRIRNGYGMPELDSPLVARHERWYASRPDYVARISERARLYLYFIVQEVQRRGMPTEIALLPMIESAFNPKAYSPSNASGIWQFIPSTGKHYGMQQNWWHDGRRDIISATNGALDYLQKLHDEFGDWQLALAAYNCGERCVQHAINRNARRHQPTDFVHLRLPRETKNYVPKLMAMKAIITDPSQFGITLAAIPNRPYFAAITPTRHIDVSMAAKLAGITLDEFKALNPGNSRPVILQDDNTRILVPADKAEDFIYSMDNHDKPLVSWMPYQSRKGQSLEKLARHFGISLKQLRKANGLMPYAKVANGQKLLVPNKDDDPDKQFVAFNMHLAPTLDDSHALIHIVRRGESLSVIAHHYHVTIAMLRAHNHGRTLIRPGQRLLIAGGGGYYHPSRRHRYRHHHYRHHHARVARRKVRHHHARVARNATARHGHSTSLSLARTSGEDS